MEADTCGDHAMEVIFEVATDSSSEHEDGESSKSLESASTAPASTNADGCMHQVLYAPPPDECSICLQSVFARGGKSILSPGCCGKFFHQDCINKLVQLGGINCPNCRARLPESVIAQNEPVARAGALDFGYPGQRTHHAPARVAPHTLFSGAVDAGLVPPSPIMTPMTPPMPRLQRANSISNVYANTGVHHDQSSHPVYMSPRFRTSNSRFPAASSLRPQDLEEDDLLRRCDDANRFPTTDAIPAANTPMETMIVSCTPHRQEISLEEEPLFHVNVNLRSVVECPSASAGVDNTGSTRIPMDIVCVLDTSGSMRGNKLKELMSAISFIRSQLNDYDRLAIIIFNASAYLVHGLYSMSETKKELSERQCNLIVADGGTKIFAGMELAMNVLNHRKETNTLSCVFLLTDGQDPGDIVAKHEWAAGLVSGQIALSIFGFGADHDAEQLQTLATRSEGSFSYIESESAVGEALGGAMGGQQATIATRIKITLSIPMTSLSSSCGSGIDKHKRRLKFTSVHAGRYIAEEQSDGSYAVTYANMFAGEQRDILVAMHVPLVAGSIMYYPLLTAQATYTSISGEEVRAVSKNNADYHQSSSSASPSSSADPFTAICYVSRTGEPSRAEINLAVDTQINRVKTISTMKAAMDLADKGDFQTSSKLIKKSMHEIMRSPSFNSADVGDQTHASVTLSSFHDLDSALSRTRSASDYNVFGGKASLCDSLSAHSSQRQMFSSPVAASGHGDSRHGGMSRTFTCGVPHSRNMHVDEGRPGANSNNFFSAGMSPYQTPRSQMLQKSAKVYKTPEPHK
jgi:uncharacterized protein YegL